MNKFLEIFRAGGLVLLLRWKKRKCVVANLK